MEKEVIIISLGGSVIVPDKIDDVFLKKFNKLIRSYLRKYKFIIVTGGGRTARNYIKSASSVRKVSDEDEDWMGIHSTRLNAHLLRTIFRDVAYPRVIKNPHDNVRFDKVLIAAGWKPGFSTDYDAVVLAKTYKVNTVVNITNIDYLHDKDPEKYKNSKVIKEIDWAGFRKIVGDKWSPGLKAPFDPVASKLAQKLDLTLVLLGKNLNNLKKFFDKKKFNGSIIIS